VNPDEFREIVTLPPVLLRREDLVELERLMLEGMIPCEGGSPIFKVENGPQSFSAESIGVLLNKELPRSTSSFSASITSWSSNGNITAGVSLTLYKNFGQFQLHADSEPLFLGKKHQLLGFFRRHTPWYGWIVCLLPMVASPLFLAALFGGVFLFSRGRLIPALLSLLLALLTATVTWLAFTNRIFPYVRVVLERAPTRPGSVELLTLILQIGLLIATILSVVVPLIPQLRR
jgi:hypothetical protein